MVQIDRIEVDQLFGLYDHRIQLHPEERITLLHGPNGVGKTVMLRLLYGLLNGNFEMFYSVPFKEFRVYFVDKHSLRVQQDEGKRKAKGFSEIGSGIKIDIYLNNKKIESVDSDPLSEEANMQASSILRHLAPEIQHIDSERWVLRNVGEVLTTKEAIRYALGQAGALPASLRQQLRRLISSPLLDKLLGDSKAYLIGTNRLIPPLKMSRNRANIPSDFREDQQESAVQHHANVIRDVIASTLAEYSRVSSQRDRTFPERLVHQREGKVNLSDSELRERFAHLEKRRNELESAGLLDTQSTGRPFAVPESLVETTRIVLSVYVEDTENKLAVFDDVEKRIALLKQIVEKRFLHTKQFSIDRRKGFIFKSGEHELSPDQLSSGEQHELVLFCELLFTVPTDSFILIDEPELSLHVAWQLEFLTDLQAVTRIRPMEILIATHSPWIVNDRWDLTAALSGDLERNASVPKTVSSRLGIT